MRKILLGSAIKIQADKFKGPTRETDSKEIDKTTNRAPEMVKQPKAAHASDCATHYARPGI